VEKQLILMSERYERYTRECTISFVFVSSMGYIIYNLWLGVFRFYTLAILILIPLSSFLYGALKVFELKM
jgi:hypothetical protein